MSSVLAWILGWDLRCLLGLPLLVWLFEMRACPPIMSNSNVLPELRILFLSLKLLLKSWFLRVLLPVPGSWLLFSYYVLFKLSPYMKKGVSSLSEATRVSVKSSEFSGAPSCLCYYVATIIPRWFLGVAAIPCNVRPSESLIVSGLRLSLKWFKLYTCDMLPFLAPTTFPEYLLLFPALRFTSIYDGIFTRKWWNYYWEGNSGLGDSGLSMVWGVAS